MLNTQLRISSPIRGTYCVFGLDQRPVDGVAAQHYERAGTWRCERDEVGGCEHIRLAQEWAKAKGETW